MQAALARLAVAGASLPIRHTRRLLLRPFEEADRAPFAAINADPEVAAWLPSPLSRAESDRLMDQVVADAGRNGFGLFAVQQRTTGDFLGFVGLAVPAWQAHFTPVAEIAWRLARPAWGQGYATEAARETLDWAFGALDLPAVWSWTSVHNHRSWRVMERLGMTRLGTFAHPRLAADSQLSKHIVYRLLRPSDTGPATGC
jgi:ribosomal-protein-alanine N-acetyltransferase